MKPAASAGRSLVMSVQVTIVGGGIVGAACARALARGGAAVTVVEGRFPGGGATAAGMGHVVVMDDSPAQLALTARSRRLWSELAADLPPEAEYRRADVRPPLFPVPLGDVT